MDDLDDVRMLKEFLESEPTQYENNLQQELDEFLNFEDSDSEVDEPEEDYWSEVDNDVEEIQRQQCSQSETVVPDDKASDSVETLLFTKEEREIIDKCCDPKLKNLLILNRMKNKHLHKLHIDLSKLLYDCQQTIKTKIQEVKTLSEKPDNIRNFVWKAGYPYFKDSTFYSAPPNPDVFQKRKNKEISLTNHKSTRWTSDDRIILSGAVKLSYLEYRQSQLLQKIRILKVQIVATKDEEKKSEMMREKERLEKELDVLTVKDDCDVPPLNATTGVDWLKISTNDLKGRHSMNECEAFWNIYVHPSINKSHWSQQENVMIQNLAAEYKYQNWEAIAAQLNNNRSAFSTCVHYYSKLCDRFKKDRFTLTEDEFLFEVIAYCRIGNYIPWAKVAYYFQNRTRSQLYHRYTYYLAKTETKKGVFTEAEDILILVLVQRFGKDFTKIASYIPNRNSIQIRNRYSCYLKTEELNLGNYTVEDDKKILEYVAIHGSKSWSGLTKTLKRTRAHLRQRYLTLHKWKCNNPERSVEEIPRRNQSYLKNKYIKSALASIIMEQLKCSNVVPTMETIEKSICRETRKQKGLPKRRRCNNYPSLVDEQLVEFFKGSYKCGKKSHSIPDNLAEQSAATVMSVLKTLNTRLNIPSDSKLEVNPNLNDVDRSILFHIREAQKQKNANTQPSIVSLPGTSHSTVSLAGTSHSTVSLPGTSHSTVSLPGTSYSTVSLPDTSHSTVSLPGTSHSNSARTYDGVESLIPPNPDTILGLRNLIVKFQSYKTKLANANRDTPVFKCQKKSGNMENQIALKIDEDLFEMSDTIRARVLKEREAFTQRFYSLFKWPSIMSTTSPSEYLMSLPGSVGVNQPKKSAKMSRTEKRRVMDEKLKKMAAAKRKMFNQQTLTGDDSSPENVKLERRTKTNDCNGNENPVVYSDRTAQTDPDDNLYDYLQNLSVIADDVETFQRKCSDEEKSESNATLQLSDIDLPNSTSSVLNPQMVPATPIDAEESHMENNSSTISIDLPTSIDKNETLISSDYPETPMPDLPTQVKFDKQMLKTARKIPRKPKSRAKKNRLNSRCRFQQQSQVTSSNNSQHFLVHATIITKDDPVPPESYTDPSDGLTIWLENDRGLEDNFKNDFEAPTSADPPKSVLSHNLEKDLLDIQKLDDAILEENNQLKRLAIKRRKPSRTYSNKRRKTVESSRDNFANAEDTHRVESFLNFDDHRK